MSRFDWEKQNKVEQPKQKRPLSNRSKVLTAYENGTKRERERIVRLIETLDLQYVPDGVQDFIAGDALDLINLIKGRQQ